MVEGKYRHAMEAREGLKRATLPESLELSKVSEMAVGDTRVAHWQVMKVDANRGCWLHPDLAVYDKEPAGERSLIISKTADGYVVDTSLITHPAWEPEADFSMYEVAEEDWIPVKWIFQEPTPALPVQETPTA